MLSEPNGSLYKHFNPSYERHIVFRLLVVLRECLMGPILLFPTQYGLIAGQVEGNTERNLENFFLRILKMT